MNSSFFWFSQLEEDELRDSFLLVFANKQDLPNALSVNEITEKLGLTQTRQRKVSTIKLFTVSWHQGTLKYTVNPSGWWDLNPWPSIFKSDALSLNYRRLLAIGSNPTREFDFSVAVTHWPCKNSCPVSFRDSKHRGPSFNLSRAKNNSRFTVNV